VVSENCCPFPDHALAVDLEYMQMGAALCGRCA
jgi:hypothetical protein